MGWRVELAAAVRGAVRVNESGSAAVRSVEVRSGRITSSDNPVDSSPNGDRP